MGLYFRFKKRCIKCGLYVSNQDHDYCYECFIEIQKKDDKTSSEKHFKKTLSNGQLFTVYIMFYGTGDEKIGFTRDLNSRIIEIKRKYPKNRLVYFREFSTESEGRRFELWLKKLSDRELIRFIADFQDKIRKVEGL